jgi:hypothetical protein
MPISFVINEHRRKKFRSTESPHMASIPKDKVQKRDDNLQKTFSSDMAG